MKCMKKISSVRKLFFVSVALLILNKTNAQDSTVSSIPISVVMPESVKGFPDEMLPTLEAKIEAIVSNQGLSGEGGGGQSFVIYPVLSIYGTKETAGGMEKVVIVTGNLSLIIKQVSTKTVFSSISKMIQGSGSSADEATKDIFNQINPGDEDYAAFVDKAKKKIFNYYNQNCSNILKQAETERIQKHFEQALSILLSVPVEASGCYDKIQQQSKVVFEEMLKYNCGKYVQEARSYAANNDYEEALKRLSWIDPTANCGGEAKQLVNKMANEVDADKKKEWEMLFLVYKGAVDIQKAKAYAKQNYSDYVITTQTQKPEISYNALVGYKNY